MIDQPLYEHRQMHWEEGGIQTDGVIKQDKGANYFSAIVGQI